jgi:hypothetical protein
MTMDKGSTVIEGGAVEIAMNYRKELMPDQGLCIQVYGVVEGEDTEILRFDCFDQDPHYHYGPVNQNIRLHMDKTTAGNPIGWTMDNIRNKLPTMIRRAGYEDLAAAVEANPIAKAKLDEAEAKARELARTQRRTVTHKRGDYMFEAGNIRFGLEFRHLANDRGLAIHVLSDVAGQEVEMLAFDCFDPHLLGHHHLRRHPEVDPGPVQGPQAGQHDQPRRLSQHRRWAGRGADPVGDTFGRAEGVCPGGPKPEVDCPDPPIAGWSWQEGGPVPPEYGQANGGLGVTPGRRVVY